MTFLECVHCDVFCLCWYTACTVSEEVLAYSCTTPVKPESHVSTGCWCLQQSYINWGATLFTYVRPPVDGSYNVSLASDNGALLWLDGTLLINNSGVV